MIQMYYFVLSLPMFLLRASCQGGESNSTTLHVRALWLPGPLLLRVLIAQRLLVDLAHARLVDFFHEPDPVGHGELGDLAVVHALLDTGLDFFLRDLVYIVRVERDHGERSLPPLLVVHPDHRGLTHAFVL